MQGTVGLSSRDGAMVQDNAVGVVVGAKNPERLEVHRVLVERGYAAHWCWYLHTHPPRRSGYDNFVALENMAKQIDVLLLPDPEQAEASRGIIQEKFEGYIRQR